MKSKGLLSENINTTIKKTESLLEARNKRGKIR
jgi:hypothetical protein